MNKKLEEQTLESDRWVQIHFTSPVTTGKLTKHCFLPLQSKSNNHGQVTRLINVSKELTKVPTTVSYTKCVSFCNVVHYQNGLPTLLFPLDHLCSKESSKLSSISSNL